MKVALIGLEPPRVVQVYDGVPPSVALPGVGSVSPVELGWRGGGELTYRRDPETGRETAEEGPARFALVAVTEAAPASDGMQVASLAHELRDGVVVETATYEAAPKPVERTAAEKLRDAGLTVDELRSLLGL